MPTPKPGVVSAVSAVSVSLTHFKEAHLLNLHLIVINIKNIF